MQILLIGSGGREHALAWKLSQSPLCKKLYCAPGNPGIEELAQIVPLALDKISELVAFAIDKKIELTIVGPEYPLSLGIVDAFTEAGLTIFGPTKAAAEIESSKSFAKDIMVKAGVPTANHVVTYNLIEMKEALPSFGLPVVLKYDGLAAGKGVHVCMTSADLENAKKVLFTTADEKVKVVLEEYLDGVEVSYIIATDGTNIVPFPASHDYKRIFNDDKGPNTGGMGTVCPTPRMNQEEDEEQILHEVIVPVLAEMRRRNCNFAGFLYAGLMKLHKGGWSVVEFNARFGDPETQSVMLMMEGDLAETLYKLAQNAGTGKSLDFEPIERKSGCAVTVVIAAANYPDEPRKGDVITGLEEAAKIDDVQVFHAGTARLGDDIVSNGGRVISVSAVADTFDAARKLAYKGCSAINWDGKQYRSDIGKGF